MSNPEVFEDELHLELRVPVKAGGQEYSVLELSEPTAAQLIAAERARSPTEGLLILVNLNAAVPMKACEQLRKRDLQRAADFFNHFETEPSSSVTSPQS